MTQGLSLLVALMVSPLCFVSGFHQPEKSLAQPSSAIGSHHVAGDVRRLVGTENASQTCYLLQSGKSFQRNALFDFFLNVGCIEEQVLRRAFSYHDAWSERVYANSIF